MGVARAPAPVRVVNYMYEKQECHTQCLGNEKLHSSSLTYEYILWLSLSGSNVTFTRTWESSDLTRSIKHVFCQYERNRWWKSIHLKHVRIQCCYERISWKKHIPLSHKSKQSGVKEVLATFLRLSLHGTGRIFDMWKIRTFRYCVHTEPR